MLNHSILLLCSLYMVRTGSSPADTPTYVQDHMIKYWIPFMIQTRCVIFLMQCVKAFSRIFFDVNMFWWFYVMAYCLGLWPNCALVSNLLRRGKQTHDRCSAILCSWRLDTWANSWSVSLDSSEVGVASGSIPFKRPSVAVCVRHTPPTVFHGF